MSVNLKKIKELKQGFIYLATNKSVSLIFASKTFIKYLKFA